MTGLVVPTPSGAASPSGADANRLLTVDALRGIAALSVCWYHMTNGYAEGSAVRQSGSLGWLGIDIFFVISGFIIPLSMWQRNYETTRNWKLFLWKRIVRIEPAYLVAVLLTLALWHLSALVPSFQGKAPPNPFSAQVLSHIGYLNGLLGFDWLSPVFWTLALEFQFYLLVALGFSAISSRSVASQLVVALLMAGAFLIAPADSLVLRYLGLFLFGVATFQYRGGISRMPVFLVSVCIAFCSVWAAHGLAPALVSIATCGVLLADFSLGKAKTLAALGAISYSLYLVHIPIGGRVVNLGKSMATSDVAQAFLSFAGVVLSIFVAYVLYRLVEKPSKDAASRIRYPGRELSTRDIALAATRTDLPGTRI